MIEFLTSIGDLLGTWIYAIFWLILAFGAFAILGSIVAKLNSPEEDSKIRNLGGIKTLSKKTKVVRSVAFNRRDSGGKEKGKPIAVIRFEGDVMASDRNNLALLVNEIIYNKDNLAGVIAVVNSPGGSVAHYGQAYAEMKRIRDAGINLEICVDTAAASGGCLMSLPANKIIAAPFAIVASIGVVAQVLNYFGLLKKYGVEPLLFTAGKYKRTVTATGEVNEEAKKHFQAQLEAIHTAFKALVAKYRPHVDIEKVCTGEHWTAQESIDQNLGLVDEIATSAEYLFAANRDRDLVNLSIAQDGRSRLLHFVGAAIDIGITRCVNRLTSNGITH